MAGNNIRFQAGTYAQYLALVTKDANALYFCTDTQQLFKGTIEFTRPVMTGNGNPADLPNSIELLTSTPNDVLYLDLQNYELYLKHNRQWVKATKNTKIEVTGSGNAVTAVSISSDGTITFTKGETFATKAELDAVEAIAESKVAGATGTTENHIAVFGSDGKIINDGGKSIANLDADIAAAQAAADAAQAAADAAMAAAEAGGADAAQAIQDAIDAEVTRADAAYAHSSDNGTSADKVAHRLVFKIGQTETAEYDGSVEVPVTAATLGLDNALHFVGVVAEDSKDLVGDGLPVSQIIIKTGLDSATAYNPVPGDVVIYDVHEYVATKTNVWAEFGDTQSITDIIAALANLNHTDTEETSSGKKKFVTAVSTVDGIATPTKQVITYSDIDGTPAPYDDTALAARVSANESAIAQNAADIATKQNELDFEATGTAGYVSDVTFANDKITVQRSALPVGSGEEQAGALEYITNVRLDGHVLSGQSTAALDEIELNADGTLKTDGIPTAGAVKDYADLVLSWGTIGE